MNSNDPYAEPHAPVDKGKQRAATPEPSERTPLLPSTSSHAIHHSHPHLSPPGPHRQTLVRKLLIVFFATLVACVVVLVLILVFALSYSSRVSSLTAQDILDRGLFVEGPDHIDVLNATKEGGVWIRVGGRVGLDMGGVLRIRPTNEDLIWTELWKGIGRWGISKVGRVSIELSPITVMSRSEPSVTLAVVTAPAIQLPLSPEPPSSLEWLTPMSIPIHIRPVNHTKDLIRFTEECWMSGFIRVSTAISSVRVTGGGTHEDGWRGRFGTERSNVSIAIRKKSESTLFDVFRLVTQSFPVPQLPGFPNPGNNTPFPPFSRLVTLKTFHISSGLTRVRVNASATFSSPLPASIRLTVPSLPFLISVPPRQNDTSANLTAPVVRVETDPLTLTHPNTTIHVHGHVVALTSESFPPLSSFVTSYLNGESPRVSLSTPLLPGVTVDTVFPAPVPRPQVLRNVTIKEMKIRPLASGTMLASGTVFANIVLPKGMDVVLQVGAVYPQLLVYDGLVPDDEPLGTKDLVDNDDDDDDNLPDRMPLPDPLPANAFAHIRPGQWLDSISVPLDHQDEEGSVFAVSAKIVDIPLEVLPGRQREFSNFVGKVRSISIEPSPLQ